MMYRFMILVMAVTLIGLQACTASSKARSPITTSLDALHGEASNQVFRDSQIRLVSIAGLLPNPAVGLSSWFRKEKSSLSAVSRHAVLEEKLSGDKVISLEIESEAELRDLAVIYDELENVYSHTTAIIAHIINLEYFQSQLNLLPTEDKKPSKTNTTSLIQNQLMDKISDTKLELVNAQRALGEAKSALMKTMAKHGGVIVLSWETQTTVNSGASLLDKIGIAKSNKSKTSGYAILGGIKMSQIMLGNETILRLKDEGSNENFYMDSLLLQAKNILYTASLDIEAKIAASLDADVKDLRSDRAFLSSGGKIKIGLLLESLANLANRGAMGASKWNVETIDSGTTVKSLVDSSDGGWKTIYVTKTRRHDLGKW